MMNLIDEMLCHQKAMFNKDKSEIRYFTETKGTEVMSYLTLTRQLCVTNVGILGDIDRVIT